MKTKLYAFKLLALLLAVSIIFSMAVMMGTAPVYASTIESDTSWYDADENEFTLTTAAQLVGWSELADDDVTFEGKTIKLSADIVFNTGYASTWRTLPPENSWTPIKYFHGVFDGQGHTISGLYVKSSEAAIGFIANVEGATIKNAAITNSYFESFRKTGSPVVSAAGSFVGNVNRSTQSPPSTFINLYSDATVRGIGEQCGGIVGRVFHVGGSTFERCVFAGNVSSEGSYVGGILGFTHNQTVSFTDCINLGTVSSSAFSGGEAGGIVSRVGVSDVTITRCINAGKVNSKTGRQGGIIGFVAKTGSQPAATLSLNDCYFVSDYTENAFAEHTVLPIIVGTPEAISSADIKGDSAISTLTGFNFQSVWGTMPGAYPMPLSVLAMLDRDCLAPGATELGASIRYKAPAGIRFAFRFFKDDIYKALYTGDEYIYSPDNDIIFGILLIPTSLLNNQEMTVENTEELDIINTTGMRVFEETDEDITFTGVIYNVPDNDLDTAIAARGYIKYKNGSSYEYKYTKVIEHSYYSVAKEALPFQTDPQIIESLQSIINKVENWFVEYDGGTLSSTYDCNDGLYQKYITGTSLTEYHAYRDKLESEGFVLYDENTINGNEFATYVKGKNLVHTYFVDYLNTTRIIYGPRGDLPGKESDNNYTKITDTLVTNVALDYENDVFGMGIVIRLEDSSFIIIDGGMKSATDAAKIYNLLQTQNVAGGKPVIAAWIITHTHEDHKGIFELFARDYSSQVVLEMFICNSVAESESQDSGNPDYYMDTKFPEHIIKFGNKVKVVKPHTGQRFYIRNAEFEVLYTHEDLHPVTMAYFNDSTTVMRMVANGQSFMWLGDVGYDGSDVMCDMYGNYIESDFVQVSHHGERGGTIELYSLINPSVAIWPTEIERYNRVKNHPINYYLINQLNVQEHIISGYGTRVIQLPYTPNS